jgi:DNA-directed RNA polymerase specialized sigma subunit, sigma24 homolog
MAKEVSIRDIQNYFFNNIDKEKRKRIEEVIGKKGVLSHLRKNFSISDDDLEDIFQEASTALFLNIQNGKLTELINGCSLHTYFLKVCTNQALKFLRKNSKIKPLFDDSRLTNTNTVRNDKLDELYGICIDTEEIDKKVRMQKLVNEIVDSMTDTCKSILKGFYWDDLSMATIAEENDFPNANAVKAQKYKCMKKYHSKFKDLWEKIYG